MPNNLMTHCLGQKKIHRISFHVIAVISVKWFYIIAEIKLGLQYEPENLDVNKVCFAKELDIPSIHEKFEAEEYFNLQGMRYKSSHLNSSLTFETDYL